MKLPVVHETAATMRRLPDDNIEEEI